MRVHVAMPWCPADAWREDLYRRVRLHWAPLGYGLVAACGGAGDHFNRAASVNKAANAETTWDVLLVVDADVLVDHTQVRAALLVAAETDELTFAFTEWRGLSHKATRRIVAEDNAFDWMQATEEVRTNSVSCCLAVPRRLWNEAGGFDETFDGWGYEDVAFMAACQGLRDGRYHRIPGPLFHLWHPPAAANVDPVLLERNRTRSARYEAHTASSVDMRDLLGSLGRAT